MKKKILSIGIIAILMVMLIILTGCGNSSKEVYDKKSEYAKYIEAVRNSELGLMYEGHTVGEMIDNLLTDSKWDKFTKYISNGLNHQLISVIGNNKDTGEKVEIVYDVMKDTLEVNFEKMYVNDEESGGYLQMLYDSSKELSKNAENK